LRPAPHCRTPITSYSLKIKPETHFLNCSRTRIPTSLRAWSSRKDEGVFVRSRFDRRNDGHQPIRFLRRELAEKYPFVYEDMLAKELFPYLTFARDRKLAALVESVRKNGMVINDFIVAVNQQIPHEVKYLIRMEPEFRSRKRRSRSKRLLSRQALAVGSSPAPLDLQPGFVSGYLIQLTRR